MKKLWHIGLLVALLLSALILPVEASQVVPATAAKPDLAAECYNGAYISFSNGHHFVAFNTGKRNAGHPNWAITKKPWQVQVAERVSRKTMNIWGPADRIGEVRAGFPWVDRLPWYYFFTPWDGFTICKR